MRRPDAVIEQSTRNSGPGAPLLSRRGLILAASAAAGVALAPASRAAPRGAGPGPANPRRNLLLINAHQVYPGISEGSLNRSAVALIRAEMEAKGYAVQETRLEAGYDVDREVEKHVWADVIIAQSPVFWINTPYIYKKYIDEVFTSAMLSRTFLAGDGRPDGQYGSGGRLQGKRHMLSLTMNAPRDAFDDAGQALFGGKSVDEVFFSAGAPYRFCGATILPAFAFQDVIRNPDVVNDFQRLKSRLARNFGV
jgi:modulator of drug activity B